MMEKKGEDSEELGGERTGVLQRAALFRFTEVTFELWKLLLINTDCNMMYSET